MSHAHSHENTVPRPALIASGVMILFALLLTTGVSLGFVERSAVPDVERERAGVLQSRQRELQFIDLADGNVRVLDADAGTTVAIIDMETKSGGFVRGVVRSLARERGLQGISSQQAFSLTLWQNGTLSLSDPLTGQNMELGGFGADNRAIFMKLLDDQPLGEEVQT